MVRRSLEAAASPAVVSFYRRQASIYDLTRWLTLRGRAEAVCWLGLRPGNSVLDLGCGTGLGFAPMRRLVGASGTITGVDLSPHMLARARLRVERNGWRNVLLIEQDLSSLNLDQRFDAVTLVYSLSMLADWRAALEHAARHVVPGGRLLILDFGSLQAPAPLTGLYRRWLVSNHTEPGRPYAAFLRHLFTEVTEANLYRGYTTRILAKSERSG